MTTREVSQDFLSCVQDHVVLFDGAMGTMIYERGVYINQCYDALNLQRPELILGIHQDYAAAGAEVLTTNTFGANPFFLKKHGFEDRFEEINQRGAELARHVAGDSLFVAGSMGPLPDRMAPFGKLTREDIHTAYRKQAEALLKGGADLLILETFSDLIMLVEIIRILKEAFPTTPLIAQMTVDNEGRTTLGSPPEIFTPEIIKVGADVVGLNCSLGPSKMLDVIERMIRISTIPVSAMPNAGLPQRVDGRNIYFSSPEYFSEYTRRFVQAGVRIVGGCCGTTPEFIKSMKNALYSIQPRKRIEISFPPTPPAEEVKQISTEKKSHFAEKICRGDFVTTVEIVPPQGPDPKKAVEQSQILFEAGVDAINIPDGPRAQSRMASSYLSLIIQQETGGEVIQHYTCRDRNLLGMVGDFLGAYAVGIKNILIITGDPPKMGTFPDAAAVFDVDSVGLTRVASILNKGRDLGGNTLKKATGFFIGVGVNPGAINIEEEIHHLEDKKKAGAEFVITQPVYDPDKFFSFLERIKHLNLPVIAGIWPLVSVRNAEFINNEVPGASVPQKMIERLKRTQNKEEAREIGLSIAREILKILKPYVQGVQISMPFGNVKYPLEVLKEVL
ncbi:MAG: bifunctional homocysteine S-methyltransferase/methylenetetrahydrofolate reductase [Candidatus Marinimicrobia bacterium]|nr:bifunctional homocysteine S-methyltransferase/methylenetetrahydrofolate reductase [Candidatus Neomarinimicrobiota bacterium]